MTMRPPGCRVSSGPQGSGSKLASIIFPSTSALEDVIICSSCMAWQQKVLSPHWCHTLEGQAKLKCEGDEEALQHTQFTKLLD